MPNEQEENARKQAVQSLERMQNFDVSTLPREQELGSELNFKEVVPHAQRLIGLYQQISIPSLDDLPQQFLNTIHTQANADFNRLEEILKFSQREGNAYDRRNQLIKQIADSYDGAFTKLHPIIAYSTSKSADFKRLETEARAMIQAVEDRATELTKNLKQSQDQADGILAEIRKTAAEQGVSQKAVYFRDESKEHDDQAERWRKTTVRLAWLMGGYAFLSLFIHKVPGLKPENAYESVQLAVSKVLIFAVISYMLYLAARNFLAHKHNAIVNKHRQNALMTFKALVDAAKEDENKEIVLTHAAACIFRPQTTAYSREGGGSSPSAKSVVELLTKPFAPDGD